MSKLGSPVKLIMKCLKRLESGVQPLKYCNVWKAWVQQQNNITFVDLRVATL